MSTSVFLTRVITTLLTLAFMGTLWIVLHAAAG